MRNTLKLISLVLLFCTAFAVYVSARLDNIQYLMAIQVDNGVINAARFGAKGDGLADDTSALTQAFDAARKHSGVLIIPKGVYLVGGQLGVGSGMIIKSDGAVLVHTKPSGVLLSASSADDWSLEGPLTLAGTRKAKGAQGTEVGMLISGCNRFIVEKLTVRDFSGKGLLLDGGHPSRAARGDSGKFAFVSLINNGLGLELAADTKYSAEYNLFTLISFSGNDVAARIVAGNNVISTSNLVDNTGGVQLAAGLNHGHGIISSSNINHNVDFNIRANGVTNGFTFDGDHAYGGPVILEQSNGIEFPGSVVESQIVKH